MGTTRHIWPMSSVPTGLGTATVINSSLIREACVFCASKTGTINRIQFRTGSNTGTAPVYQARVETVGTTTGLPTGTLWATNTNATFTPANNTTYTLTLTANVSVTRGDWYAIVFQHSSGTIDASNHMRLINMNQNMSGYNGSFHNGPVTSSNSGSSWTRYVDAAPSFTALYTDNDAEVNVACIASSTSMTLSSMSISDLGTRFIAPLSADCVGALYGGLTSSGNMPVLQLLSMANTVLAARQTITMISSPSIILFDTPAAVTDGQEYRLVLMTSSFTGLTVERYSHTSDAARLATHGTAYATMKEFGIWSDFSDSSPILVPLFASPVSGGGGGGGGGSGFPIVGKGGIAF